MVTTFKEEKQIKEKKQSTSLWRQNAVALRRLFPRQPYAAVMLRRLSPRRLFAVMLQWLSVAMISAIAYSCTKQSPGKSEIDVQSEQYRQTVGDFYTSLAAIQSDQA